MKYGDSLVILGVSFLTSLICEAISWVLIYRTNSYRNIRSSITRKSKKVETMKGKSASINGKRSNSKKIDRFESSLKGANQSLSFAKIKSGVVVGVTLMVIFGLLNSLFEGKVVAKLPFKAPSFVQRMSHRGLPGNDPTDCSMVFLYMLCSLSIRQNLQKLLGFSPPRSLAPSPFAIPDSKSK